MLTRTALLLASVALLGFVAPAQAQDSRYDTLSEAAAEEAIEWQTGHAMVQPLPDYPEEDAEGDSRHERHHGRARHANHDDEMAHQQQRPRLAYSEEERVAWLSDCQVVMRGEDYYADVRYEDDDRAHRGLRGGVIGAVIGGFAGNRIANGDRLAGTLIGAGVGGLAGAAIDGAFDRDDDRDGRRYRDERDSEDAYAADYCEAYLRRYEASGQAGYSQMVYAQPVMMMGGQMRHGAVREIIREEWVEVEAEHVRHAPPARRAAPERGKRTRIR